MKYRKVSFVIALAGAAVLSLAHDTQASLIQWPTSSGGNGHYYMVTDQTMTWTDADTLATSLGGYLATVQSAAENDFLRDNFFPDNVPGNTSQIFWIGLNDAANEGTFVWSNGEPVGYTNFEPGEPNNYTGGAIGTPDGEDYVAINWYYGNAVGGAVYGSWNDTPNAGTTFAGGATQPYAAIIEFVPEPSSFALATGLLLSLAAADWFRRRAT